VLAKKSSVFNLQVVRFAIVGVANTLVGLALIYLGKLAGLNDVWANLVGYGICICVSFTLNRRWTFQHDGAARAAFYRYLIVVLCAYLANLGTVLFAIDIISANRYLAQALGVPVYTLVNYFGSKFFAFKNRTQAVIVRE